MKYFIYSLLIFSITFVSCNSIQYAEADFKDFESVLEKAQKNKEDWTNTPVGIATKYHRFHNGANEFTLTQNKKNRGENFDKVEIVLTSEGILDDSVNGIKTRMRLEKKRGDWQIDKVEEAYKCVEGRGQSNWAGTLCQ